MEGTSGDQQNELKILVAENSNMNDKSELNVHPEEIKFGSAGDTVCINEIGKQDIVFVEREAVEETNLASDNKTTATKDITEFPQNATKVGFPLENLNLCQIISSDERDNNLNQPLCNDVIADKAIIARNAVNFEDKTTSQWDSKILDPVTNNDLVCSEIENYLKNNLNLPNAPRRETQTAKLDLTNELFKNSSEISDTNDNKEKTEVLSSIETTIFDKLTGNQSKLDLHANISFDQCEPGVETNSSHSNSLYGKNIPICYAGVTTCESIEKNERIKSKCENVISSYSNSDKSAENQNIPSEGATKPTSTIDFLSGSFRSEEASDSPRDKTKNRNVLRNVVVAKLSEAHAENLKEPNKNTANCAVEGDVKMIASDTSTINDTLHTKIDSTMKSQTDSLNMKRGQIWSSDSEGDSDSSSDRSSYNSSFDNSDDSSSTISMISKRRDGVNAVPRKWRQPKTKGEFGLEDLPPIEDLFISVKETELEIIGTVTSIVEELVIVQGNRDQPALDLDSVLFLEGGKPLGQVFDVFGPVVQPSYAVRFNTGKEIAEKGIEKGLIVYSAPTHTDITKYVFPEKLRREKGSDASWENNNEPPEDHLDYSDDEKEKEAKKGGKPHNVIRRNENLHTINRTPLRPPVFQVPRIQPSPAPPHPGFPYGPPPPLPPFGSRYPGGPVFGGRPNFTNGSNNNSMPFCMSSPPPPPPLSPGNSNRRNIPFSVSSPLPLPHPPPPPPPPPPPVHPPGNPLSSPVFCPPLQHNMFGPYGTTLPSFSGSTDIMSTRPLMPPSRIGAPSVAPFPTPPFASGLPIPPRPQYS